MCTSKGKRDLYTKAQISARMLCLKSLTRPRFCSGMSATLLSTLDAGSHFIFTKAEWHGSLFYPPFTDEEAKTQIGK